jgi:hypothetical protein
MVIFVLKHQRSSELAQAVTIPTYIREVSGSNVGWDANYSDWKF